MGLDARLIAAAGQVPNIARNYIEAEQAGIKTGMIDNELRAKDRLAQFAMNMPKGANVADYYTQGGFPEQGLEFAKKQAEIEKTKADAGKTDLESHLKMLDISSRFNQGLMAMPQLSKQAIMAAATNYSQQGLIKPEHVRAMEGELANVPDNDAALRQIIDRHMQMGLEAKDKLSAAIQMRGQDITAQNNQFSQGMQEKEFGFNQDKDQFDRKYKVAGLELQGKQTQNTGNKAVFDQEQKLADDHKALSKTFNEVRDGYTRLAAALPNATTSAAATLAGATSFMKLLDPGSVVRESELGMALAATGIFDRATNYINVLQDGKVLTESQAADFSKIAKQIYDAAAQNQKELDAQFTERANKYGLDPKNIITDYKPKNTGGATETWDDNRIMSEFGATPEEIAKFKALKGRK